jgi:hypothetical protein
LALETLWTAPARRIEVRKITHLSVACLIGLSVLAGGRAAWAAHCPGPHGTTVECDPLEHHGGPFLAKFEIHPLYYGEWKEAEIDAQQTYVVNLAAYMSGKNAPVFGQPMTKQYGVDDVTVAAAKTASPNVEPSVLSRQDILNIIAANQNNGKLPPFGPHTLIIVFPGPGFSASGKGSACGNAGGCHGSESTSAFWAVVPAHQEKVVIAHEIFEASADPAIDNFKGWDESVDQCDNAPNISLPAFGKTFQIPPVTDNTNGGACSTTGYTSLGELQDYGVTHAQFVNDYITLYKQGWRLYILQSYVLANGSTFGDVRYNAVWRPGNVDERLLIEETHEQFVSDYNTLYAQGWNLYILQAYVLANGTVTYNAVLRRGTLQEQVHLGRTLSQFVSDFNTLDPADWRLYTLQTYVTANGELLYNAIWRPGNLTEVDAPQATSAQFDSNYDYLSPRGWRLYVFQSYVVPGAQVLHDIVWRPGTHNEKAVYGWTYADYRAKYDDLFQQGWRLYILNAYVLHGEVRYDAVWRLGTIDRPL